MQYLRYESTIDAFNMSSMRSKSMCNFSEWASKHIFKHYKKKYYVAIMVK